jgi:DNA-binding NarL/FixJ family response regulator
MFYLKRLMRFLEKLGGEEKRLPPPGEIDRSVVVGEARNQFSTRSAMDDNILPDEILVDAFTAAIARGTARKELGEELLHRWSLLTYRERQVAILALKGYTNRQIAARLGIAQGTVKTHIRQCFRKLGYRNKRELRVYLSGWNFFS